MFKKPHFPYFLLNLIQKVSPSTARLLKYGRLNPNTASYWNERYLSGEYQAFEDARYLALRQEIMNIIPPRSRVLDAGCGTGRFMDMLRAQKECSCTGIDISCVSINIIKSKGFQGFRCELPDLPEGIRKELFDVCILSETLEHLSFPFETLKALEAVLREAGRIIVSVPDDCMKPKDFDETRLFIQ